MTTIASTTRVLRLPAVLAAGLLVLAEQLVSLPVALAANWPAQFGESGTDAGAEWVSRGTALTAPVLPLAILAVALLLARRGGTVLRRVGVVLAGLCGLVLIVGSLGEAVAPATADVGKAVLVGSGVVGTLLGGALATAAARSW
jgi:hypothetical protein